jgi:hypothetical protein
MLLVLTAGSQWVLALAHDSHMTVIFYQRCGAVGELVGLCQCRPHCGSTSGPKIICIDKWGHLVPCSQDSCRIAALAAAAAAAAVTAAALPAVCFTAGRRQAAPCCSCCSSCKPEHQKEQWQWAVGR